MLAARYYKPGDIRVEEVPMPALPKGGALLKVLSCGLCGTDKRIFSEGHFHIEPDQPRILGHEIIAEIFELDQHNHSYKVGQRVTIAPNFGCGTCRICQKGYTQLCETYDAFGISIDGGFAQFMAVPEIALRQGNVIPIPEEFSNDEGAMIEISTCSYRGLSVCNPKKNDSVLIIGGGAVTYLMCRWARTFNVEKLIVSVIDDAWGELSKRGEPDVIINSRKENLKERLFEETNGLGADVVMVACSAKDMDEIAPDLASIQGHVNFFGGLPKQDAIVCINSRAIHYREVTVTGTTGANVDWIKRTIEAYQAQPFDLELGITHHFPLVDIQQAFKVSPNTPRLKTIITCN
jgi:L-iditol 2-dehydrogenase